MSKGAVCMLLALALAGCGGYFDQHPANVRPENEAVATVLAAPQHTAAVQPEVIQLVPAPPSAPAERSVPAPPVATASAPPHVAAAELAPAAEPTIMSAGPAPAAAPVVLPEAPSTAAAPAEPDADFPWLPTFGAPPSNPPPSAPPRISAPPPSSPEPAPAVPTPPPPPPPESAPAVVVSSPPPPPSPLESAPAVVVSNPPPAVETQPAIAPAAPTPDAAAESHCAAVAKQRAEDARAAGLDDDTQAIVRKGTYGDCMTWARAHPASP